YLALVPSTPRGGTLGAMAPAKMGRVGGKLEIGIAGPPSSGKTSVFNALSRAKVQVGGFSAAQDAHRAVVKVPDPRLPVLTEMFKPKSVKPAEVQYVDVGGLAKGAGLESA